MSRRVSERPLTFRAFFGVGPVVGALCLLSESRSFRVPDEEVQAQEELRRQVPSPPGAPASGPGRFEWGLLPVSLHVPRLGPRWCGGGGPFALSSRLKPM